MKTCLVYRFQHLGWLIIGLLVPFCSALAQADEYYKPDTKANQQGYWRLSTSMDQRSTTVSFFDRQDQLLYQETLSGYHLKPSQRSIALLDDVLSRLTMNQLVLSQLQSQLVPFPVIEKRLKRSIDSERPDTTSCSTKNRIHCSINANGIIRLNVLNPTAEALAIRLMDEQGQTLYYDATQQQEYYSRLNVSSLANGSFRLSVLDKKGRILDAFQVVKSTRAQFNLQAITQDAYAILKQQ